MAFFDFVDDGVVFLPTRFVDMVVGVLSRHRSIRRDNRHVEFVDVVKLVRLRLGRSRHAGQFLVKPEIILNRDRSQRLGLAVDLHPFLRLDRLMQPVAPTSPWHFAPSEFIYDHHFVFLDDVLNVLFKQTISAEQLRYVMDPLRLGVAMLLALRLQFLALFVTESLIEIDLGELANQIRQDERDRIVRVDKGTALLRQICVLRFFVDGEEQFFFQGEEFFFARVLIKRELGLIDRLAFLRIFHHAQELLVPRLTQLDLEHEQPALFDFAGLEFFLRFTGDAIAEHGLLAHQLLHQRLPFVVLMGRNRSRSADN